MKRRLPWVATVVAAFALGFWLRGSGPAAAVVPVVSDDRPVAERRTVDSHADAPPREPDRPPMVETAPPAPAREMPAGLHPRAAGPEPTSAAPSMRGGRRQALELVNACDDVVTASWLDYDGREQGPSIILPGASLHSNTWEGHGFRLRLGDRKRTFLRDVVVPPATQARIVLCGTNEAFEILDAGEDRTAPQCTVPFLAEPARTTPSVTLSARYPVVIRNTCRGTKVRIDWVQFDGGLRPAGDLEPGSQLDQSSFVGHQWRVRDFHTARWIRDFALDGGPVADACVCD